MFSSLCYLYSGNSFTWIYHIYIETGTYHLCSSQINSSTFWGRTSADWFLFCASVIHAIYHVTYYPWCSTDDCYRLVSYATCKLTVCITVMSCVHCMEGLAPDCSNSSVLALEILQSCAKPSILCQIRGNSWREPTGQWNSTHKGQVIWKAFHCYHVIVVSQVSDIFALNFSNFTCLLILFIIRGKKSQSLYYKGM